MFGRGRATMDMSFFTQQQPPKMVSIKPFIPKQQAPRHSRIETLESQEVPERHEVNPNEPRKQEDLRREIRKNIEVEELKDVKKMTNNAASLETLMSQLLLHKNKPAFIMKNKNVIKNLSNEDQKTFLISAKDYFK